MAESKYVPLQRALAETPRMVVKPDPNQDGKADLTFIDWITVPLTHIERIMAPEKLPPDAYNADPSHTFWGNTRQHPQGEAWDNAGWKVEKKHLNDAGTQIESITFIRKEV